MGKHFFDSIKELFTHPYTDCRFDPIVSFLTTNRVKTFYEIKGEGILIQYTIPI